MPFGLSVPNLVLASLALAWLLYRLNKVLSTPLEDLIKVLGLEVPAAPIPALLDITPTSVSAHWKPAEERNSVAKYGIWINGQLIGEVSPQDVSVSITGLLPGRCYNLRVVAINSANFQACSKAIRVRTLDDTDEANPHASNGAAGHSGRGKPLEYTAVPSITSCRPFSEAAVPSSNNSTVIKEGTNSAVQAKRGSGGRRDSPAGHTEQHAYSSDDSHVAHENQDTVRSLTSKLDALREEADELEKQDKDEVDDFMATRESLGARKESLRQQLKERDDESKDLKKNVTSLERANTAAQSKKTSQERALQQKLSEREKMRGDIERWDREVKEMQVEGEQFVNQKEGLYATNRQRIDALRATQDEDLQVLKAIEEKIHEQGTHVKDLEEEKKSLQGALPEYGHSDAPSDDAQKQFEWQQKLQMLESQYNTLWMVCREVQDQYHKTQQHLQFVSTRVGVQPAAFPPLSHDMPAPGSDVFITQTPMDSNLTQISGRSHPPLPPTSVARSNSPFYSLASGLSLPPWTQPKDDRDTESLTGGALTSPTADALLPSDLLGDEPEEPSKAGPASISRRLANGWAARSTATAPQPTLPSFNRNSAASEFLPGLGAIPGLGSTEGVSGPTPASPNSINSLSPSLVSSPYGSRANLHNHKGSDSFMDSDRRSIKSTSSSTRAMTGSRRFHEFFSRQRGKTTSNEGPELGTLKPTQSQSLPRQWDDPLDAQNKKTANSGGLFGQMSSAVLGRRLTKTVEDGEAEPSAPQARVNPFSMFSPWSRSSAIPRPASPRPPSSYSTENSLPHPSTDARPFGWSVGDNMSSRGSFVATPWSNFSSRRASLAHGSTNDLLSDIAQSDEDGQDIGASKSPPQAPIGTKPSKSKSTPLPQLDPTARTFKSMFSKDKKAEKSEKSTPKSKKKAKKSAPEEAPVLSADESSPSESRKSKDGELLQTVTPTEGLTDAEERLESGPTTPSEDAPPLSSSNRDSFMKKLTRTRSSNKFNLPGLKDKGGLFSRKSYQSEDNDDDAGSAAQLGRSVDSVTSSPQPAGDKRSSAFSLASLTKRGRKGANTPSISEASMASETGDESEEKDR